MDNSKRFDMIVTEENKVKIYDRKCKQIYCFDQDNYAIFNQVIQGKTKEEIMESLQLPQEKVERARKDIDEILQHPKAKLKKGLFYPNQSRKESFLTDFLCYIILYCSIPFLMLSAFCNFQQIKEVLISAMNQISVGTFGRIFMILIVSTAFHELGHMVTARHFGCIVLELGVKMSGFIPCAYTSIYGTAFLKSKAQRILTLSGGILVNALLAGIACWTMQVDSISQISVEVGLLNLGLAFINSLIFFEFDGYYILEEFVGKNFKKEALNCTREFMKKPSSIRSYEFGEFKVFYTILAFLLIPLFIISMIPVKWL